MVPCAAVCRNWSFDCRIELWPFHNRSLHPGPFSWHYLFRSSIPFEETSGASISYYCYGMVNYPLSASFAPKFNFMTNNALAAKWH